MCRPWCWILGLIPVAVLAILALTFAQGPLEQKLTIAAEDALLQAGQSWGSVKADGRDITLSGTAPSEQAVSDAVAALNDAAGIRRVLNETVVRP